ncbi:MAG TPA: hypothetical protein VGJ63_14940 [Micromonosporaceae bacterium]
MADQVGFGRDGLRLTWLRPCAEARYCGSAVSWSQVRDGDPDRCPPQLRLLDGGTLFVARGRYEELAAAMAEAGVAVVRRPDVWADLLEPFVDTDYGVFRATCEERLRSVGFTDAEVAGIRRRVRWRMYALTALTWEWGGYGQCDLLLATSLFVRRMRWPRYRRFRSWTDAVAERARVCTIPSAPQARPSQTGNMASEEFHTEAAEGQRDRRFHGGAPDHLDDDELERRTEAERVEAGLEPYDPDDVPPAADAPVPSDITETDEFQGIEDVAARQEDELENIPLSDENPFPPTRYEEE